MSLWGPRAEVISIRGVAVFFINVSLRFSGSSRDASQFLFSDLTRGVSLLRFAMPDILSLVMQKSTIPLSDFWAKTGRVLRNGAPSHRGP
jgi:hypothetical protein